MLFPEGYMSILSRISESLPSSPVFPSSYFFFFFSWPQQKVSGLKEHLVWSTLSLHIWDKIHQPGCLQELSKAYKDRGGEMQPCASLPLLLARNTRRAENNSHALSSFFTHFAQVNTCRFPVINTSRNSALGMSKKGIKINTGFGSVYMIH